MNFGQRLKQERKKRDLTLDELQQKCGVSRSMLSKIERGEKNPTIAVVAEIARGLDVTVSQLLGEDEEQEVIMIKKDQRYTYKDPASGFERHVLSPILPAKGIEFILNIIPAGQSSGKFPPHPKGTKEYITVTSGTLNLELNGKLHVLNEGDSIYFDADVYHQFTNIGNCECSYYLVIDSRTIK